MATTTTKQDVRDVNGATLELIPDETIDNIISIAEKRGLNKFNVKIEPTTNVDFIQVIDENFVKTNKNPLLSIKRLKQNNLDVNMDNIKFNSLGTIRQDFRRFINRTGIFRRNNMVFVEYLYGWVEEKDYKELTTVAISSGTGVEILVADNTKFAVDDYIRIKGFDGFIDVAKVTATVSGKITVDELIFNHEVDSLIEILTCPSIINDWILYESAYQVANHIVGNTSNLATSYTYPEHSATIGVAWTHWTQARDSNAKTRDDIAVSINAKLMM